MGIDLFPRCFRPFEENKLRRKGEIHSQASLGAGVIPNIPLFFPQVIPPSLGTAPSLPSHQMPSGGCPPVGNIVSPHHPALLGLPWALPPINCPREDIRPWETSFSPITRHFWASPPINRPREDARSWENPSPAIPPSRNPPR